MAFSARILAITSFSWFQRERSAVRSSESPASCFSIPELVELGGHGVDLSAKTGRRLVDEVDCLVREEAIGDVTVREDGGRHDGRVLDPDTVVNLVLLAQAAKDADRVLDRWLVDEDRLETALQGRILFNVLAILVERRRADGAKLAAGEGGLEQVGGVDRAFCRACTDQRVQLVDEQDHLAV